MYGIDVYETMSEMVTGTGFQRGAAVSVGDGVCKV